MHARRSRPDWVPARRGPHIILKCFRLWWQRPESSRTMSGMKPTSSGCQSCQPQTTNTGGIKNILTKIKFKTNCATLKNHSTRKKGERSEGRQDGKQQKFSHKILLAIFFRVSAKADWPDTNTCGYCASQHTPHTHSHTNTDHSATLYAWHIWFMTSGFGFSWSCCSFSLQMSVLYALCAWKLACDLGSSRFDFMPITFGFPVACQFVWLSVSPLVSSVRQSNRIILI